MSKTVPEKNSPAVPVSHDRRNFLIAGTGLALAATAFGSNGAALATTAGKKTHPRPSDVVSVQKHLMTTRKLGSMEVSSMGLGCLPMVGC